MIRLKHLLAEATEIDWDKPFTLSPTDPWEYIHDPETGNLYTRKRGSKKWIDMERALSPEKYDIAYRRIKDVVSGFKKGGSNTDSNVDIKNNEAILYIRDNTPFQWRTERSGDILTIVTIGKNGDAIATAGDGIDNKEGRITVTIDSEASPAGKSDNISYPATGNLTINVPEQYKWETTKLLKPIATVDWSKTHSWAWLSGESEEIEADDQRPAAGHNMVAWHFFCDINEHYKTLVTILKTMSTWTALDKK